MTGLQYLKGLPLTHPKLSTGLAPETHVQTTAKALNLPEAPRQTLAKCGRVKQPCRDFQGLSHPAGRMASKSHVAQHDGGWCSTSDLGWVPDFRPGCFGAQAAVHAMDDAPRRVVPFPWGTPCSKASDLYNPESCLSSEFQMQATMPVRLQHSLLAAEASVSKLWPSQLI